MISQKQSYPDEQELVSAASKGDLDAFNQLVLLHQDLSYHHAYSILGDGALAEDVVQDSFIRAFQNIARFRGGSFRAWILKIVTNSAYDMLRRLKRHPMQALLLQDEAGQQAESALWLCDVRVSIEKTEEQNEFSNDLYRLLNELPDVYRIVLILIDIDELDYAQAASTLKVPIGLVKSRLARARLQMSKKLYQVKNGPFCLHHEA